MDQDETEMTEEEFDARWRNGRVADVARHAPHSPRPNVHGGGIEVATDLSSLAIEDVSLDSVGKRFEVALSSP